MASVVLPEAERRKDLNAMSAKGHPSRFGSDPVMSGLARALGPKSKGTSLGPVPLMPPWVYFNLGRVLIKPRYLLA